MQILTIDIGAGTQDIFLYDSRLELENGYKLILPSPTLMARRRLKEAAQRGEDVLLTGVTMGGGPSMWAAEDNLRRGLRVYATPEAARSFNDDLDVVREMGIQVVSEDEANRLPETVLRLELRDFDFDGIARIFEEFGVSLDGLRAVAVAVFDHGASPPGYSDRQFRFDYLDRRIREENRLSAFAYRSQDIPPSMTRLQAVAKSAQWAKNPLLEGMPLVVMDTAPAAVLGATFDPRLRSRERLLVANVGNFHTLAFRLGPGGIEGVFEHHTGLLDLARLEAYLCSLANGTLTHAEVFASHGHGALIYNPEPLELLPENPNEWDFGVVVTGPRRDLIRGSNLRPYFAVPFGDMMITGCFGLLSAAADLLPELSEPIRRSLSSAPGGLPPWEVS
jgi:uncharacterized protein (DUF1786 family)